MKSIRMSTDIPAVYFRCMPDDQLGNKAGADECNVLFAGEVTV